MRWTVGQAREHPLWRGLTEKERRFFELLEALHLDDSAAAIAAFDLAPQSIQPRLNQLRGAQDTGFLYRMMMGFGVPSREEIIAALWQLAQTTKDEQRKLVCIREAGEMCGYKVKRKEKDSTPGDDGDEPPPSSPTIEPGRAIPDLSNFRE